MWHSGIYQYLRSDCKVFRVDYADVFFLVLCPPHLLPSRHVMLERDTNLSHFHPRKTHLDSKTQSSCSEMDTQMPGYIWWCEGVGSGFLLCPDFELFLLHEQLTPSKKVSSSAGKKTHTLKHYLIWKFVLVTALWRKWCSWRRFNASITQCYLSLLAWTVSVRGNTTRQESIIMQGQNVK